MEITIIGSGNVAAALAGAVAGQDSLHLKQLCARNPLRGRELADRYGAEYIARPEETAEADLYLIAVSDSAVEEVSARLRTPPGATVAHTSGGLGIDSLRCVAADRAVCYPLQTFSAGRSIDFRTVPLFIEHHDRAGHRPGLRGGALDVPRS
ncbi:MAG: NAD(P)-binding domain-containing protein [Alistipes inops]